MLGTGLLASLLVASVRTALAATHTAEGGHGPVAQPPRPAQEADPLPLPDLVTLPPSSLVLIEIAASNRRLIRFSNSIANIGTLDLDLTGEYEPDAGGYRVYQRIPIDAETFDALPLEGFILYHPEHYHWHLEDFARYEIWSAAHDGRLKQLLRMNGKVSYCIMDTDALPGTDHPQQYLYCGPGHQGLSTGWADTYERHLPGQWVEITGLPDGFYALRSVVDPTDMLHEADDANNDAAVTFYLHQGRIRNIQPAEVDLSRLGPVP